MFQSQIMKIAIFNYKVQENITTYHSLHGISSNIGHWRSIVYRSGALLPASRKFWQSVKVGLMSIHRYMHISIHIYIYKYMHISMYINIYIRIYIYIYYNRENYLFCLVLLKTWKKSIFKLILICIYIYIYCIHTGVKVAWFKLL